MRHGFCHSLQAFPRSLVSVSLIKYFRRELYMCIYLFSCTYVYLVLHSPSPPSGLELVRLLPPGRSNGETRGVGPAAQGCFLGALRTYIPSHTYMSRTRIRVPHRALGETYLLSFTALFIFHRYTPSLLLPVAVRSVEAYGFCLFYYIHIHKHVDRSIPYN